MIDKNKLPDKYLVKTHKDRPLWNKFADYINKLEGVKLSFNFNYYGQEHSRVVLYSNADYPDYKVLTLEEWDSIVNPKFILPEKWVILGKEKSEVHKWFNNTLKRYVGANSEGLTYFHYPEPESYVCSDSEIREGYTEITFDQFKEYVLNKTNNNMNNNTNQEIIGYKLKSNIKQYEKEAAEKLCDLTLGGRPSEFGPSSKQYKILFELGLLDRWFDEVYKPKYQLPEINGHSGVLRENLLIYGNNCARFDTEFFEHINEIQDRCEKKAGLIQYSSAQNRKIKSITLDSNVTITIDQIKQIVDYINANKN